MIPFPAPSSAAEQGGGADISALHSDVMAAHILARLDGPTLASITSASLALRRLCSDQTHRLWLDICHSTWPSTAAPRVTDVISAFPDGGPRAFFAHSFPLPASAPSSSPSSPPKELISAVDIRYKDELIFSKVHEMETSSSGFEHSPFMVDLVDPKDGVFTQITHPDENGMCASFTKDVTLSWIMIDPNNQQVVNLSSYKPVSVHRQWLGGGRVRVTFASILLTEHRHAGPAQCGIVVTFDASNGGETLHVWEVSIQMEGIDGNLLNGKDSLLILQMALEGKRVNGIRRAEESRRRFKEFLDLKKKRKERKEKVEMALGILSVVFGASAFLAFSLFLLQT
ncbi:hypothetical protein DM860_010434 [Cuscuta australis]|uniref:F-box domain-containing protein n=1 Tax=Cuscuta australis TaxID=267555 RepID=A0A328E2T2_9ASTE|nr:hypothetical protein DM860_010434 [Cuscuta australis]